LENRLAIATGLWRESTDEPFPKLEPGPPDQQIQQFELRLVEVLRREATPESARDVAEQTWSLVHDRPETDPVKMAVVECHDHLARISAAPVPDLPPAPDLPPE